MNQDKPAQRELFTAFAKKTQRQVAAEGNSDKGDKGKNMLSVHGPFLYLWQRKIDEFIGQHKIFFGLLYP